MKPILFNTEMVRAILDGRKTVTRRRPFQMPSDYNKLKGLYRGNKGGLCALFQCAEDPTTEAVYAPYRPSDILYVRETWAIWSRTEGLTPKIHYKADGENLPGVKWRPSIHMPKEAARIFLRVTGVWVERLRDITPGEAVDEGAVKRPHYVRYGGEECLALHQRYIDEFAALWDSTIKPADRPLYGWDANPWVWVIEFERISRKEATP